MKDEPTRNQVRHLQNRLEALIDESEYQSALSEGTKSWTWEKVRKRLRKKRRNFDHQVMELFKSSSVPPPQNLYGHFDAVWEEEILGELPPRDKSVLRTVLETAGLRAIPMAIGPTLTMQSSNPAVIYAELVSDVNEMWKSYCRKCVSLAKSSASSQLNNG